MKSRYLLFILGAILLMILPFEVKADAPEWLTITSNPRNAYGGGTDYHTYCGWGLSMIETDQGRAFCVQGTRNAPTQGCVFHRTDIYTEDPGLVWLLTRNTDNRTNYHCTQAAIYNYINYRGSNSLFHYSNGTSWPYATGNTPGNGSYTPNTSVWPEQQMQIDLFEQAKNQTSSGSGSSADDARLVFDASTIEQGSEACEGDVIKTRLITIKGEGINWDTLKVSALEVPEAYITEKNCSGQQCTFRMAMSLSAAQGHTSLTLRAEAETDAYGGRYYIYESYSCPDASPQELIYTGPGNTIKTASLSIPINPDACTDYSLDVSCGNCDETGEDPSFIIQDTTNWSGIINSSMSSNENINGYFDQANENSTGSDGGKCHVYCREEYRVYFPNESDEVNVGAGRYFTFNLEGDIVIGTVPNYKEVKVDKIKECQATEEYEVTDENGNTHTEQKSSPSCMSQYDASQQTPKAGETGDVTIQYTETYEDSVYNANNPINLRQNDERQEIPEETVSGASAKYEVINWYELPIDTYRYVNMHTWESAFKAPTDSDDIKNNYRDLKVENLPISYENYGVNINGENVGAQIGFAFKLPDSSNMSDAFLDENDYFKTASTSNDNIYTKYVNNGCSGNGLSESEVQQLKDSTCADKYDYGTSGFCSCANERTSNKAGTCIADINSGLDSEYYQCEVLVCPEGEYTCSNGECSKEKICHCEVSNGVYYVNGNVVSYDTYVKECGGTPPDDPGGDPGDDPDGDPGDGDNTGGYCEYCDGGVCCPGLNMVCPDGNGKCPAPAGGEIIYRTIDLSDPFPGQNAENRRAGWNWCSYNTKTKKFSCNGLGEGNPVVQDEGNPVVQDHIINNRNVASESIYSQKQPLYEYTLTYREINAIKDYNDKNDYSDWNMSCSETDSGDKVCSSNFLDDISLINVSGTCSRNSRIATCAEE